MPQPSDDLPSPNTDSLWRTVRYGAGLVWAAGRGHCIAMGVGALISALLAPVTIIVLGVLVSEISNIVSDGSPKSGTLSLWILIVAGAAFAGVVVGSLQRYAKMRLKDALSLTMQREILVHAARLDASVLDDRETQNILDRARSNPGPTVLGLLDGIVETGSGIIQLFTRSGVLIWVEPWWSLGLLAAVIPFFAASYWISRVRHERNRIKTTRRRWTRYYSRMLTHRDSAPAIKVLSLAPVMLGRHDEQMYDLIDDNRRVARIEMGLNLGTSLLLLATIGGALWFAAERAASGELEIGAFSAFWMAVWRFRGAASKLGSSVSGIQEARLAICNLKEFFDLKPRMQDVGTETPEIRGEIEFRNVSFRYTENSDTVLEDVSIKIQPGEVVALVGPNGAGKSTLAKLISRLYEPTTGEFLVDGVPVQRIPLDHFYQAVSFVFQSPNRYEATAGENIAYGDWHNLQSDPERIRAVAEVAGVDQVISRLPDGYDTILGRMFGEHDLSGGQWKKIAIAQALASDPSIVILDEPAANLDIETERLIHRQLRELLKDRTTILISHRFSTVRMADRIIVLVDGRVMEQGTHSDLLQKNGVYAAMCRTHSEIIGDGTPPAAPQASHSNNDSQEDEHHDRQAA